MLIHGLQKMTLLDYPGKVACTVFFGGCDFRCPFCHNWELLDGSSPAQTDSEAFLQFLNKRKGMLEGVVVTGGEPLLRKELPELLGQIKALGYPVKLDTNGNHPEALGKVIRDGLVDYVAMDIKNSRGKYAMTAGLEQLDTGAVEQSVRLLMNGPVEYEFRTTVVSELHNDDSFLDIREWIAGAQHYYLQYFTDRDTVPFEGFHAPEEDVMTHYAALVREKVPSVQIRG